MARRALIEALASTGADVGNRKPKLNEFLACHAEI